MTIEASNQQLSEPATRQLLTLPATDALSRMSTMDNPPAEKKRKAGDSSETLSWRAKSIEEFGLQPVPDGWKDSVAIGSEEAWKSYYAYRSRVECRQSEEDVSVGEIDSDGDCRDDENSDFMKEWKHKMTARIEEYMANDCQWHWTPRFGDLIWEECDELRSAEYYANVWSPYAIPHAIELEHRYHCRTRYSSIEFGTVWSYREVDFEEKDAIDSDEYKELCSNCFKDEELRADVITSSHMNKLTGQRLRSFLFGSHSEECKNVTCSDMSFWLLLFGSMGTTDPNLEKDPKGGDHGYSWQPCYNKELRKKLYDLKAVEGNDREGDPNGPFDEYYPNGCSWLKHRLLKITGNLGAVTKNYQPPTIKDAPGYHDRYQNEEGSEEDEDDDGDGIKLKSWTQLKDKETMDHFVKDCGSLDEALEKLFELMDKDRRGW